MPEESRRPFAELKSALPFIVRYLEPSCWPAGSAAGGAAGVPRRTPSRSTATPLMAGEIGDDHGPGGVHQRVGCNEWRPAVVTAPEGGRPMRLMPTILSGAALVVLAGCTSNVPPPTAKPAKAVGPTTATAPAAPTAVADKPEKAEKAEDT